jgi:acetate kinase
VRILTINAGSSSVRLSLFEYRGNGHYHAARDEHLGAVDAEAPRLTEFLASAHVDAVAHRVVHGGARLVQPVLLDAAAREEIAHLAPLAPLHNPRALVWMRACDEALAATVPQVAVFDTAFYADLPAAARTYALPRDLCERFAVRRYGFHGLAHQAMWQRWCHRMPERRGRGRVISLQLGGGCSITAIADGRPLDTSMGFSPLEGLMMATRSGDVDPGAVTYLMRMLRIPPEDMEALLNELSGLLGVAGESSDMRTLLTSPAPAAREAVDLYCYRARKYIGAYLAVLGGADAILFGGGVGENAAPVRADILAGLQWAGIEVDAARNETAIGREARINKDGRHVDIWVIPVDEARVLAEAAVTVLQPSGGVR